MDENKQRDTRKPSGNKGNLVIWLLIAFGLFYLFNTWTQTQEKPVQELSYSKFFDMLKENAFSGKIRAVIKTDNIVKGILTDGGKFVVNVPENDQDLIKALRENVKDFGFTTGHAYTVANIYEIIKNITKEISIELSKSIVAIVGAGGSIGSGIARIISENRIKEIKLIDRFSMVSSTKLSKLKNVLQLINIHNRITISNRICDIEDADLIIAATNSPVSIIKSEHLKSGAVIIDDSFPKNVPRDVLRERDDVILLEGGVSQMPKLNIDVSRHMPDLLDLSISKLVSCSQAYGCLAETLILAALGHRGNYGLGDADPQLAKDIMKKGKSVGFNNAIFQNYGFAVEESRIAKVKNIIKNRKI